MNIGKFLTCAFLCFIFTQVIIAQPDATADFVTTEKEISITPEFPGFCNKDKGVTVTVNEDFESVAWHQPQDPWQINTPRPLIGQSAILKIAGEWRVVGQFTKNGVTCTAEKKFLVADLSDPNQIQKYFENAGFYSFSLWRDEDPPTIRQDDNSDNRSIECKLEEVKFEPSGYTIFLKNQLQNTLSTFEPVQTLGGIAKVTNNQCLCLGDEVLEFNVTTGIWAHQFFKQNGDKEGLLFLKGKLPNENSLPLTESDNNQKEYLEKNHTKYISNNVGADQQADVLAKNLLMCRRVGGFLDLPESSVPCGTFSEAAGYRYVFTTAGVPVLLPSGSFNYYFPEKLLSGAFPGALSKFQLGSSLFISHFNKNNEFTGFFYDTKATLYKNFQNPSNLNDFPFMIPTYWEKTSGDGCDVPVVLGNDLSLNSNIKATSDGGIGQSIKTGFNDVGTFDLLNYQTEMINVCPEPLNNNAGYADYWLSKTLLASTNYYCLYEIDGKFIAAFSNDHGQDFYYKEFINGCWIPIDVLLPYDPSLREWLQLVSEATHVALDVAGAIPVFGTPADLAQATFYALEGDTYSSGLAMVAVLPFGEIAKYGDEFVMTSKQILNYSNKGPKGVVKTLYILYKFGGKPKIFDVRKVLKKLKETRSGITEDEFKVIGNQLINDLNTNFDVFDAIGSNLELIKAWEKLLHTNILQPIRTNVNYLSAVSKQLTNYPNVLFKLERVLPNIPSNQLDNFFSKLDNPKSIDHVRSLSGDFENIPGINVANYVPNGLAGVDIPPPATWADPYLHLPGNAATTFTGATAKTLSPGQKIYRVLDQTQNPAGGYWTYSLPTNKAQLYGGSAVRPEWNAATHYVEYTIPPNGLKVWDGPAARQAILDNVNQAHLPGGTTQIYIPDMIRQDGSFSNLQLLPLSL